MFACIDGHVLACIFTRTYAHTLAPNTPDIDHTPGGQGTNEDERRLRAVARALCREVPLILEGGHDYGLYHPRVRLVDDCWLGLRTSGVLNLQARQRRVTPNVMSSQPPTCQVSAVTEG